MSRANRNFFWKSCCTRNYHPGSPGCRHTLNTRT